MGDRRTATDPHASPRDPDPTKRSPKALHAVLPAERLDERRRDEAASRILGPRVGPPRQTITPAAEATGHLSAGLVTTREPVVAPDRGKCTRRTTDRRRRVREDLERRRPPNDTLNPAADTRGPIRLPLNGFTYS
jgi:hypothetical protein